MLTTRSSRLKYNFSLDFFRPDGHVIFSDLTSARAFAEQMSALRSDPVPATDLYALSLLDEAYHILLRHFLSRYYGVMGRAMGMVQSNPESKYQLTLTKFIEEFPPVSVFCGEVTAGDYLSTNIPTSWNFEGNLRLAAIEEMLLIHTANRNSAINSCKELVDETAIGDSAYLEFMQSLLAFFDRHPGFDNSDSSQGETLTDVLFAPIKASPDSLEGQLLFIVEKWGYLLGESFSVRILRGLDNIREETVHQGHESCDSTNAETLAPTFAGSEYAEYERYNMDKDWMPRLNLPAQKSVCPHLGLVHDPATHMNFPSIANQCKHSKKPRSPSLTHQRDYCLSHAYGDCVLNQTSQRISMPSEISAVPPGFNRTAWIAMVLTLLVGSTVFFLSKASLSTVDFFITSAPLIEPVGISISLAETLSSPTNTGIPSTFTSASTDDIPTVTPPPGETPVFLGSANVYEVTKLPPGASHGLLVHIIMQGETLEIIAANYSTTVQAILAVNYKLTSPIWADYPIVIPVGAKEVSGSMSFEVYVVEDYETISAETLANILAVDVKDIKFYNLCGGNYCQFIRGDVLLIPHNP